MTTPFTLGNDFTDQYSMSIIQNEGKCHLDFGNSGRRLKVDSSTGPVYLTDQGQTFKVCVIPDFAAQNFRLKTHQRNQKDKRKIQSRMSNSEVRATE